MSGHFQNNTERLPFTIRRASTDREFKAAAQVRQLAYGRHLPEVAATLGEPEKADFQPDTDVLVAFSQLDGEALATMRIHRNNTVPLPLEGSMELPAYMRTAKLSEATRFAIANTETGRVLRTALCKAFWQHAVIRDVDYLVITARRPLDRMYEQLRFKDVDPTAGYVPMKHVGGIPHRVLFLPAKAAQGLWLASQHPLYRFMVETDHPDIQVNLPEVAVAAEDKELA